MKSKEYIKGTLKTIVLKLLSDKRKMYGYEISQLVTELSVGEIELTYGALYPILYGLEKENLVIAESEIVEGRARKYYSLTKEGNATAAEKVEALNQFTDIIKTILAPSPKPSLELWGV